MKTIPTAEEFFLNNYFGDSISQEDKKLWLETNEQAQESLNIMIEFAKLHVEAALKAASKNATVTPVDHEEILEGSFRPIWGVDKDSILNAYPLDNIK
jgi:hypothetical protein